MKTSRSDSPSNGKVVFLKARKVYARAEKVTVSLPKPEPARTVVANPLTEEQKTTIKDLITEWHATSNLANKPVGYGRAYTLLYRDALAGCVNNINQIEQHEYKHCLDYIKQRIRILETVGSQRVIRRKADWSKSRISAIHSRCKELGVSDEIRKAYQIERFKKASLADFTDDQIEEMYAYTFSRKPTFAISRLIAPSVQEDREIELLVLLGNLEADAKASEQVFNRERLPYSREDMLYLLFNRNQRLFSDKKGNPITVDQFEAFWKKQKVCRLKRGR